MNIDDTIKEYFRRGIKLFYETHEKRTMQEAFEQILTCFFHQGIELRNGVLVHILPPAEELPTLEQFRYWYKKEHDLKIPTIVCEGRQQKRADLDNQSLGVFGPGSTYEIIAVVADIYLVSALDRQRIVGRPVMYLIIDVFSDLIVGMSVSLDGPSWLGATLALENMARDKVVFCKEYGFDITEDEWPSHHLPRAIYTDMKELFSKQTNYLVNELNIQMTNTVPYQPDWKGCFERNFRILYDASIHWLPGSVNTLHKPGRKDDRLDACLTLYDFRRLLISCILEHNTSHRVIDDHFDQAMIDDEVEPYPRDIWKWGIRNRSGLLHEKPINVIRFDLLLKDYALVTPKGIRFHHLHYTCNQAIQDHWFEKVHDGMRSWRIPVVYDPQTSDSIYFCDSHRKHIEACSLVEEDKMKFTNCSWFEIEDYFVDRKQHKRVAEIREHQLRVDGYMLRDRIIEEAEKRTKED